MKELVKEPTYQEENEDIIHLWEPLTFDINEKYEYVPKGKVFTIFSNLLYYGIAFPILKVLTKLVYDLKIEGKEKIRNLKGGAISVSNHVLVLDCAMVGLACGLKKVYYTTQEGSFKIPFVRKLIKLLRAIPIRKKLENKKYFMKELKKQLKEKNIIHFYPEAALWPYYDKIRNFKKGAFNLAIENNVPIVPMIFKFREPKGIRGLLKRKKDVTLVVLDSIIIEDAKKMDKKQAIEKLKEKVREKMQIELEKEEK